MAKDMLDKVRTKAHQTEERSLRLARQHLASHFACTTCRIYLESSDKLQDHYRDSPMHPTCKSCGVSFETLHEWSNVRSLNRLKPPFTDGTQAPNGLQTDVSPISNPSCECW